MKKLTILFFIFVFCIAINIAASANIYTNTRKSQKITFILQEFDQLSGKSISNQELALYMQTGDKDKRVAILKAFFRRHDSPLYEQAEYIVKVSDENGLDYRLLPAIAMQESTACKVIPKNSYNCWGWGIYGNKITRFESYQTAIETIARGLKKNYIDHGLISPEDIMAKYNPSSNGSWARGVSNVLGVLE